MMTDDNSGFIDLRPDQHGAGDPEVRRLAIGRLRSWSAWGWRRLQGRSNGWLVSTPSVPCAISACGIIKTMHRAFTERGQDRGIADYVIDNGAASSPVIGRLVATGCTTS
jgi:hypothetical protein